MSSLIVEVCEVSGVEKHPNADKLELLTIKGWSIVEKTGRFKVGDSVVYFPPDSVLPKELSDRIGCTKYLSNGRVKPARLRGLVSCGVVWENLEGLPVGTDLREPLGVTKWEPPPEPNYGNRALGGNSRSSPGAFHYYTGIENWNNYPNWLEPNEEVVVVEKTHGSNLRMALIEGEFIVGSHYYAKAYNEEMAYWKVAVRYGVEEKMKRLETGHNWILFGEVFGCVQDLRYGLGDDVDMKLFDVSKDGNYLDYDDFESVCRMLELPVMPVLFRGGYCPKMLAELATGQAFQGEHIREGVVVRPVKERPNRRWGRTILKKINPDYLVRKKGTEFH